MNIIRRLGLVGLAAFAAVPATAQDAKWHLISVEESYDPVAWFILDKIESQEAGRKKIVYALIMREEDEYLYDVPDRGWFQYHIIYDCERRQSQLTAIDTMSEEGQVLSTEPKEREMREIVDGDDGKYFAFVCQNRRDSKVRVSTKELARSARSLLADAN